MILIVSRETMVRLSYRSVAVQRSGAEVIFLPGKTKGRPLERPPEIYEQGASGTDYRLMHMAPPMTARERTVNHMRGTSFCL